MGAVSRAAREEEKAKHGLTIGQSNTATRKNLTIFSTATTAALSHKVRGTCNHQ